jgi:uncharacterized protein YjiS (DUF1127 family)
MTHAILTAATWLNFDGVVDLINDIKRKRAAKALERQTIKELSALSDKELHDIGIGRSQILGVARGDVVK